MWQGCVNYIGACCYSSCESAPAPPCVKCCARRHVGFAVSGAGCCKSAELLLLLSATVGLCARWLVRHCVNGVIVLLLSARSAATLQPFARWPAGHCSKRLMRCCCLRVARQHLDPLRGAPTSHCCNRGPRVWCYKAMCINKTNQPRLLQRKRSLLIKLKTWDIVPPPTEAWVLATVRASNNNEPSVAAQCAPMRQNATWPVLRCHLVL